MKCDFFDNCGGCKYEKGDNKYKTLKKDNLLAIFQKNNIIFDNIEYRWIGYSSRRKIILNSKDSKIGFFKKNSHEIIEIDKCIVSNQDISNLIPSISNLAKKINLVNKINITKYDNLIEIILFITKSLSIEQIIKIIDFAKENNLSISTKYKDESSIIYKNQPNQLYIDKYKINFNTDSFIQATKEGLEIILNFTKNIAKDKKYIADLYAGCGAYSFRVADLVKKIDCFEGSKPMCISIDENSKLNLLHSKIKTFCRDLYNYPLNKIELKEYDLIIINPPRNGATPQIKQLSQIKKEIIYVSCNPQTFTKDASILLKNGYKIKNIVMIDQFFLSDHIELIAHFYI